MLKKDFQELNEKKQELNKFSYYSSMAFQMLIIIFIGVAGGISIDKWLHMKFPVFTIFPSQTTMPP